ncbi:MAG: adenylate/guanylate cyclase domain-containing protein [Bacteroidia bacterium]
MNPNPVDHKLAVIVFADIVGYTALMQQNEQSALKILNRFKEVVQTEIPLHGGEIIQYFGDGALLAFDSSSKALACALVIQTAFQAEPEVPVRIGMHLGDVLFKNDNAFGHGVNVASRIESIGLAGAVLLSKTIRDQVKNKSAYQLTSLGSFAFKNVEEPIEVYAVSNPGFVVPKRSEMQGKLQQNASPRRFNKKLLIPVLILAFIGLFLIGNWVQSVNAKDILPEEVRQEKVAVAVFNNFTNDPNLDAFGNMASDWITLGLRQINVKTTSPEMMRKYKDQVGVLPGNPDGEVSLQELTNAQFVVTGSYYQKGDSLQIASRLESTKTGDNIYDFPPIWGLKSQKEELIVEIREKLKGFWTLKKANKLSTLNPPKYEAYQAFLQCGRFDVNCFQSVLAIDSTFLLARIYCLNGAWPFELDSLSQAMSSYVKQHWEESTEFEKNFFTFVESRINGNYLEAQLAMEKNLQLDPQNMDVIDNTANGYVFLNQPAMLITHLAPVFDQYGVFKDQISRIMIQDYFLAFNRTGRQKELIELIGEKMPEKANNREFMRALMLEGDVSAIQNRLDSIGPESYLKYAHMFHAIFPPDSSNPFMPLVRKNLESYADPKRSLNYYIWSNYHLYNWDSKAFAVYQLKEWEKAERILLDLQSMDWKTHAKGSIPESIWHNLDWHMDTWREGLLGTSYARQRKTDLARGQIEKLESFRASFPGSSFYMHLGVISYWQARIHAILGEKELSVARLTQSMKAGRTIEYEQFIYDWDLKSLQDYEPYQKLIRPPL